MVEDALDDGGVFDAGDDPEVGAASIADIEVDVEHAFQAPGPGHGGATLGGRA